MRKTSFCLACGFLGTLILGALLAPWIVPFDPYAVNLDLSALAPNGEHWLGTDFLGRDILARTLMGARVSLAVGFMATLIALGIGTTLGMIAGYMGGPIDRCLQVASDVTLAFPHLLLAIAVAVVFQGGIIAVCAALALVGWAGFARVVRGSVMSLKERPFVNSAQAMGCSQARILTRHMLPHILTLVVAVAGLRVGGFILGEASLSFLGLGVQPPYPSWGSMVHAGMIHLRTCPWAVLFPGVILSMTILACNVAGDYLHDCWGRGVSP
jgi:ABC-type dipeptide/oligopeptide/nickel transport system permease subunit